jgi:hypothetical protein|tara:strand:- start:130 stop:306 length:177 start_codon:yes stop_codon:yes gene_type:complete
MTNEKQINELIKVLKNINSSIEGLLIFAISESNILKRYNPTNLKPLIKKYNQVKDLIT